MTPVPLSEKTISGHWNPTFGRKGSLDVRPGSREVLKGWCSMKKETKAALLSAFVFPGAGQMYLKRYLLGLVLMMFALTGIVFMIATAATGAMESLNQLQKVAGGVTDLSALSHYAAASVRHENPYDRMILIWLGCCWVYSVIDAYGWGKSRPGSQGQVKGE
jgi:TM2 domain-containing membrane protein YozV